MCRCSVDLTSLPRNVTHDFTLPLVNREGIVGEEKSTLHFTLCITGTKAKVKADKEEGKGETRNYVSAILD